MLDLGAVVRIGHVTARDGLWVDDGVVIEVVPPQTLPKMTSSRRHTFDYRTRYVVRTATRIVLRDDSQMEIIIP